MSAILLTDAYKAMCLHSAADKFKPGSAALLHLENGSSIWLRKRDDCLFLEVALDKITAEKLAGKLIFNGVGGVAIVLGPGSNLAGTLCQSGLSHLGFTAFTVKLTIQDILADLHMGVLYFLTGRPERWV